jgi:hypothetical protein
MGSVWDPVEMITVLCPPSKFSPTWASDITMKLRGGCPAATGGKLFFTVVWFTIVENLTENPLEKGFDSQRVSSFLSENLLRSEEGLDC